jgi:hypothetical protein
MKSVGPWRFFGSDATVVVKGKLYQGEIISNNISIRFIYIVSVLTLDNKEVTRRLTRTTQADILLGNGEKALHLPGCATSVTATAFADIASSQ